MFGIYKRLRQAEDDIKVLYHWTDKLSEWDDLTRSKFNALTDYLDIELENGVHVVKNLDSTENNNQYTNGI